MSQVTPGVLKEVVRPGNGPQVQRGNTITVHCTGNLVNPPKKFWSTKDPGQKPFTFQVGLGKVIQARQKSSKIASRHKLVAILDIVGNVRYRCQERSVASRLPKRDRKLSDYNRKGYRAFPTAHTITPNADLMFEIEILEIK
ncbi:hypothetical protein Bbelb_158980 [Branchiostoma belcheri]|nr:hypothetical protein Bbelb_158980 [Branchiostoma belcheri]